MELKPPSHLYHYSTVESLALILKNKTLKFSRLDVLDDLEEAETSDDIKLYKYCFISSWTDSENESIPMWKMYTNEIGGVRLRLPSFPFKLYRWNVNEVRAYLGSDVEVSADFISIIPVNKAQQDDYTFSYAPIDSLLLKVEYTADNHLLSPKLIDIDIKNGTTSINFPSLGRYKRESWEFQDEWRYKLIFLPISLKELKLFNGTEKLLGNFRSGKELPFKHFFLSLDDRKFKTLEVMLSPKISDGNREIVERLVEKYNPEAQIIESSLQGKLR